VLAKAAKNDELRECFTHPPLSSEQILHPKKYWNKAQRDDPVRIAIDASALPKDWKVLGQDTLGELSLALFTQPFAERGGLDVAKNPLSIMGVQYTNKAAEGWGGDRLVLLGNGDARVLYLVTVWDTPEDENEFFAAATSQLSDGTDPAQKRWSTERSSQALARDDEHKAVTLRLEWKTKKGAEGLPAMLPWSVKK
jgi:hypothetical protein